MRNATAIRLINCLPKAFSFFSFNLCCLYLAVVGKQGYHAGPQVYRQMPRVGLKWVGRCCLSIDMPIHATLECTSPAKRLPLKTAKLNSTSTTKEDKNKQVHFQIKIPWKNITKTEKYKKDWNAKYQRIITQPMKTKTIKYTHRLRHTWWKLLKLSNTKNKQEFYDGVPNRYKHC